MKSGHGEEVEDSQLLDADAIDLLEPAGLTQKGAQDQILLLRLQGPPAESLERSDIREQRPSRIPSRIRPQAPDLEVRLETHHSHDSPMPEAQAQVVHSRDSVVGRVLQEGADPQSLAVAEEWLRLGSSGKGVDVESHLAGKGKIAARLPNREGSDLQIQPPLQRERRVIDPAHQLDGLIPINGESRTLLLLGQEADHTHQEHQNETGVEEAETAQFFQWNIQ